MQKTIKNKTLDKEEFWCLGLYLSGLIPIFPFSNVVLPMAVWLLKKNESERIAVHGRDVLNFQITMSIVVFVLLLSSILLMFVPFLGPLVIFIVSALVSLFFFGCLIYCGIKAYQGEFFKLPCTINFIKGEK